jgi:hypothetical protein
VLLLYNPEILVNGINKIPPQSVVYRSHASRGRRRKSAGFRPASRSLFAAGKELVRKKGVRGYDAFRR